VKEIFKNRFVAQQQVAVDGWLVSAFVASFSFEMLHLLDAINACKVSKSFIFHLLSVLAMTHDENKFYVSSLVQHIFIA
jgi:hypothetical protein